MTYPYAVMRALAGPMASSMSTVYATQLKALENRTMRSLQAGVSPDRAQELHVLLSGCQAALQVLEETPDIIERWDADLDTRSTDERDRERLD